MSKKIFDLISKYFGLYQAFFKASLVADLEFRLNFVLLVLAEFIWYSTQLILYKVLYKHIGKIGSWDYHQMQVFVFLALFIDSIYMILWDPNFSKFNDEVRKGSLDLLLTKPINSMFMISSQKISISHIPCLIITGSGLIWALNQISNFNWLNIFWLLILIPSGLSVIFVGRLALNSSALIFSRADFLQYIWYSLFRLGLRPDAIYKGFFRFILIFIMPFAMVASIPTRFLLEPIQWGYLIWAITMPVLLLSFMHWYWKFCMKYYTSASS